MQEQPTQPTGASDRDRAAAWRRGRLLSLIPLLLVLIVRLLVARPEDRPLFGLLLLVTLTALGVLILWSRRDMEAIGALHSRSEFSDYVSLASPFRRSGLIWMEYAMARASVDGEVLALPIEYQNAGGMLTQRMMRGTRMYARVGLVTYLIVVGLLVGLPVVAITDDRVSGLIIGIALALVSLPLFGIAVLVAKWRAKRPINLLGRRVEAAATLNSDARWAALLDIARDHLALDASGARS